MDVRYVWLASGPVAPQRRRALHKDDTYRLQPNAAIGRHLSAVFDLNRSQALIPVLSPSYYSNYLFIDQFITLFNALFNALFITLFITLFNALML